MVFKIENKFLVFSQILLVSFLLVFTFSFNVDAITGKDNVTVKTLLDIGNVYPEITSIECNEGSDFDLTPANVTTLSCLAVIKDYNGQEDINQTNGWVGAVLFDTSESNYGDSDDEGDHYLNSSCSINESYGDEYEVLANCTFQVEYYANPGSWNLTLTVNDSSNWQDQNSTLFTISQLLALGLPDTIYYGEVNATAVSEENITSIINYGNTLFNLTLEGYAQTRGDGYAMNCSKGSNKLINAEYEKYNLTASTAGSLTLSEFENNYLNLTSSPVTKYFGLSSRVNDLEISEFKEAYFRIYVPRGVAGTCEGNIIFGATTGIGS